MGLAGPCVIYENELNYWYDNVIMAKRCVKRTCPQLIPVHNARALRAFQYIIPACCVSYENRKTAV